MFILNVIFLLLLIGTVILMTVIAVLQIRYNLEEAIRNIRIKKYREYLIDKISDEKKELSFFIYSGKKISLNEEIIDAGIEVINSFSGEYRKKIITMFEAEGVVEYLFKKLEKTKSRTLRDLYIYQIGELRSNIFLEKLLYMDLEQIGKKGIYKGYFFALSTIVNEWIESEKTKNIEQFIKRIFEIVARLEQEEAFSVKRVMEILLNENNAFFNYILKTRDIKESFIKKITEEKISLKSRGEIIYIFSVNQVYDISEVIKKEISYYSEKNNKTQEEEEYMILLIKGAGELLLDDMADILIKFLKDKNWVARAMAAKYLEKHVSEKILELLYDKLFDENWWVRNNAANSIKNSGYEGTAYLMRALTSSDRFAKEIAAHAIINSNYYDDAINIIKKEGVDLVLEDIMRIINEGNNINILDEIISDKDIKKTDKIRIINEVKTVKFLEYYNNSLKKKCEDKDIIEAAEKKIKELFLVE